MSKVEYILVNGDFEVHKPGCADIKKAVSQRKTDYEAPMTGEYDGQTDAVLDFWDDIICDNHDHADFAKLDTEEKLVYLSTLFGATHFFPCTKRILKADQPTEVAAIHQLIANTEPTTKKITKAQALVDEGLADTLAEARAQLKDMGDKDGVLGKQNPKRGRTATRRIIAEGQAERREDKLMRPPTKTVSGYVQWLKAQLGPDQWADLAKQPERLAEVSLQNYGAYQAAKRG